MTFDEAVAGVLKNEGGYVFDIRDPGGETNYGVSKRAYPNLDIKNLTIDQAREIYRRDYWAKAGCDLPEVPDEIKFDLFDTAVNSGVSQAIRLLQKAANVPIADGVMGPQTIEYLGHAPAWRICTRFNATRLIFMTTLTNWPTFGRGWAYRVASNLLRL